MSLQEEVMEFVNSIAKIVHMEVSLHGGAANKNMGDAFLLVWKFPTVKGTQIDLAASPQRQLLRSPPVSAGNSPMISAM